MEEDRRRKRVIFILIGIILLGTSCVTQKACLQKFPIVERHDTTIIYRDTIITVPVFSVDDTTVVWGTVFDTVYASSGTAHAITYVVRDTIRLMTWQSDTTLQVRLDSAFRELQIKETEIYTIQAKCDKSKFEKVVDKLIVLLAIVFGGLLVINLIKLFK